MSPSYAILCGVRQRPTAPGAVMAVFALAACGCELALGDLPTPIEDLPAATSAATTGVGGASGAGMSGGFGGGAASAGTGGAGGSGGGAAASGGAGGNVASGGAGTGGQGGCCDCDGDKQLAVGLCGGDDCDDGDPKVYKDEPVYYDVPNAHGFDWDCSGAAELNPTLNIAVDCSKLLGLDCNPSTGFLGTTVPMCGDAGKWGTCVKKLGSCMEQVIESNKKMTCK